MNKNYCQAFVRCKSTHEQPLWRADTHSLTSTEDNSQQFVFTKVLEEGVSHRELYEQALSSKVDSLLDGSHSNLAVLAYGPSCGGKSHTVFGTSGQTRVKEEARGVIYRCGEHLLRALGKRGGVAVSFLQVFDDGRVADLFDTKKRSMEIVFDESSLSYWPPSASQQKVSSSQELLRLIEKGYLIRNATGCVREPQKKSGLSSIKPLPLQQYRPHSSHAVFRYKVQLQTRDEVQLCTLYVVDFAGRSVDHPSTDPGIDTLTHIIHSLASDATLFPKTSLTKLLKLCFGGNCDTIAIANVSLNSSASRNCLQLLSQAMKIRNFAKKTVIPLSQSDLLYSESGTSLGGIEDLGGTEEENQRNVGVIKQTGRKPPLSLGPPQTLLPVKRPLSLGPPQTLIPPVKPLQSFGPPQTLIPPVKPLQSFGPPQTLIPPVKPLPVKLTSLKPVLPSPLFVAAKAHGNSKDNSSQDSISLDSDTDSSVESSTPLPVPSGPPPPPLRGIPHFNPDSPISSQLTTTPLIPSIAARPSSASVTRYPPQDHSLQQRGQECTDPVSNSPNASRKLFPTTQHSRELPEPIQPLTIRAGTRLPSITRVVPIREEVLQIPTPPPQVQGDTTPHSQAMPPDGPPTDGMVPDGPPTDGMPPDGPPTVDGRSEGSLGDVSNTSSSSMSLTSDSDSELEMRDTFSQDMQPRALAIQGFSGRQRPLDLPPSYPGTTRHPPAFTTPHGPGEPSHHEALSQTLSNAEIHLAAMEGVRVSEMKRLVMQYGVDYKDQGGRTPLMYAVLGNQPKLCEQLIKLRASLNMKDMCGLTALLWATFLARPQVIRVLLKGGADPSCTDLGGRTVYHWAMKTPNLHCLKWLCKHANHPSLINQLDGDGLAALHWAVMGDQAQHIRHLLTTTSADASIKDRDARPPLTYAVLIFSPACIRAILELRESVVNLTDHQERTALHYACAEGSADCVRTLLSFRSCDLHCTDNNGTTPLHWAAAGNQPGLVQLLIRRGADRAQCDASGMTPLDHAQERGHTDCIKILHTYGLRRHSSSLSIASHAPIPTHGGAPPTYDEQGHVIMQWPNQRLSLSIHRQPADGQDETDCTRQDGDLVVRGHTTPPHGGTRRSLSQLLCCCKRNNQVVPLI